MFRACGVAGSICLGLEGWGGGGGFYTICFGARETYKVQLKPLGPGVWGLRPDTEMAP